MITAAVLVLTAGFAMAIGYKWGSHEATENAAEFIENLNVEQDEILG